MRARCKLVSRSQTTSMTRVCKLWREEAAAGYGRLGASLSGSSLSVSQSQLQTTPHSLLRKSAQNAVHILLVFSCGGATGVLQLPNLILSLTQHRIRLLHSSCRRRGEEEGGERRAQQDCRVLRMLLHNLALDCFT